MIRFQGPPLFCRLVQHRIDVGVALLRTETVGEIDAFIHHDPERRLRAIEQFESADPEYDLLHQVDLLHGPVQEWLEFAVEAGGG